MTKFKSGDKVIYTGTTHEGLYINNKEIYTVERCNIHYLTLNEINKPHSYRVENFEPMTEEPKQMKATDKITVEITLAELAVSYMVFSKMRIGTADNLYNTAKQMLDPEATIREATFRKVPASGIIDKCNNPEDVFELMFPEPPKKSKEQIKIEELQETIDKAARELKELREMGENK